MKKLNFIVDIILIISIFMLINHYNVFKPEVIAQNLRAPGKIELYLKC